MDPSGRPVTAIAQKLDVVSRRLNRCLAGAVHIHAMDDAPRPDPARAFDFWLGAWDVFAPDGRQVGTNHIEGLLDGRVLQEHWQGRGGISGTSLNALDVTSGRWHQTWIDSSGSVLLLDGGPRDGGMVLEGLTPNETDPTRSDRNRISWIPAAGGGEVRQLWEVSTDDGATWTVAFDGRYRPQP